MHSARVFIAGQVFEGGHLKLTVLPRGGATPTVGAIAVDGGFAYSIALLSDGTVWTWGRGIITGQPYDASLLERQPVPVQVQGLSGVRAIGAGTEHAFAVREQCGTIWGWGLGFDGRIGDGTDSQRHLPVPVAGIGALEQCDEAILRITPAGSSPGQVTISPSGQECLDTCFEAFDISQGPATVTLTAQARGGGRFSHWGGDCSGADVEITLTVDASKSCTARFSDQPPSPIAAGPAVLEVLRIGDGRGTVAGTGISCPTDCAESFNAQDNAVVTLTATPDPGSTFAQWLGCDQVVGKECTVTMSSTRNVSAFFLLMPAPLGPGTILTGPFELTITKDGAGSGTVISSPAGINCGTDCAGSYDASQVVALTPSPATGSIFGGWRGHPDCSDGTVTMDSDKTCNAAFDPITYTLTAARDGTGKGTITSSPVGIDCGADCQAAFGVGTVVTLTAIPDPGHEFLIWQGCDTQVFNQCTVELGQDTSITAVFGVQPPPSPPPAQQTFTLNVNSLGTGSGTVTSEPAGIDCPGDCSEGYASGTSVTLTATPDEGSSFAGWLGCDDEDGDVCTVTVDGNREVTATFSSGEMFTLTVRFAGFGAGRVTSSPGGIDCDSFDEVCRSEFLSGTSVTLTAEIIDAGFFSWGEGDDCAHGGIQMEVQVTMDSDKTCTASFQ